MLKEITYTYLCGFVIRLFGYAAVIEPGIGAHFAVPGAVGVDKVTHRQLTPFLTALTL